MFASPLRSTTSTTAGARPLTMMTLALAAAPWLLACSSGPPPEPPPALTSSAEPTAKARPQPTADGSTKAPAPSSETPAPGAAAKPNASAAAAASGDKPKAADSLSIQAAEMPSGLSIDGKLAEWGQAIDKHDMVVATSKEQLVVVLPKKKQHTFSLAAVTLPPPDIGWAHRVNYTHELNKHRCEVEQHYIGEASFRDGAPLPPEVAKRCMALLADHQAWVKRYHAQFVRHFRVQDGGVQIIGKSSPQDVPGAKVATTAAGTELTIPVASWPALTESPLKRLFFSTGEGAHKLEPPINGDARGWIEVKLAQPLDFDAYPGVLAALLGRGSPEESLYEANRLTPDFRVISYHPSEPKMLRRVVPVTSFKSRPTGRLRDPITRPGISESKEPVFSERLRLDKVQVGITKSVADYLIVLKNGKLTASMEITGDIKTLAKRGDEIHLIVHDNANMVVTLGHHMMPPHWEIHAINKQGELKQLESSDFTRSGPNISCFWTPDRKPFSKPPYTRFGAECTREKKRYRTTWQWVPGKKRYEYNVMQLSR